MQRECPTIAIGFCIAHCVSYLTGDAECLLACLHCGLFQARNRDNTRVFTFSGKAEKISDGEILITELPIGTWTSKYKEFLETLLPGGAVTKDKEKKDKGEDKEGKEGKEDGAKAAAPATGPIIKDFEENHTDTRVSFTVTLQPGLDYGELPMENPEFVKIFKMQASISESNMVLVNGTVEKFTSVLDIFEVSTVCISG